MSTNIKLYNRASVVYSYMRNDFNEEKYTKFLITNENELTVNLPENILKISISVDKHFATIGDILTYTVKITNLSDYAKATNVVLKETIEEGTEFIEIVKGAELKASSLGFFRQSDTVVEMNVGDIEPRGIAEVVYTVKVISTDGGNYIIKESQANYINTLTSLEETAYSSLSDDMETAIYIFSIEKISDKDIVQKNDIITYKCIIKGNITENIGYNIIFEDVLSDNVTLVPNSIKKQGGNVLINNSSENTINLDLGTVIYKGDVTISFKVRVNEDAVGTIENQFQLLVDNKTTLSNITSTEVSIVNIEKTATVENVNYDFVRVGDKITYNIYIDNLQGSVDLKDIYIKDVFLDGQEYVNNSTIINNNNAVDMNPSDEGIYINEILKNTDMNISFSTLFEENKSEDGKLKNQANITYNINGDKKVIDSNKTEIPIADIKIEKTASKEYAQPDNIITYTTTIYNTGGVNIVSAISVEDNFLGYEYVPDTLIVDNILQQPLEGGSIQVIPNNTSIILEPNESATFKYNVKVVDILEPPIINNKSTVTYIYENYPEEEFVITSNVVSTKIRQGKAELIMSADTDVVEVDDIINYTITVNSIGNVEIEDVIITSNIPEGTEFVEGSVIVNGEVRDGDNPEEGILIGNMNPGTELNPSQKQVNFSVKVISSEFSPITNVANGTYIYYVDLNEDPIVKNITSNIVKIEILKMGIEIIKQSNVECAALNEIFTYKIIINNKSDNIDISDIIFKDELIDELTFINRTFKVDEENMDVTQENLIKGVNIGNLSKQDSKTVTFNVRLDKIPCFKIIENKASITYSYIIKEGDVRQRTKSSNLLTLCMKKVAFKQISVEGLLEVKRSCPKIDSIIEMNAHPTVVEPEIIDSPSGKSHEGQNLTGKKMVIKSKICLQVMYIAKHSNEQIYTLNEGVLFSDFIVIPSNISDLYKLEPILTIEDIAYSKISDNCIYYNITILIESGI